MPTEVIDKLSINTIRTLSIDAVQKANSGHPGTPMGAAAMAYTIWSRILRHNPANPQWPNRDRFVLSPGHASMLLHGLLHLTGYDLSLDDLKQFRQWGSRTPGHPEYGLTPGVELTTGPLGAGFAAGVGMAIAERFLAEHFNRPGHDIVDHHVYGIVSDGGLMEGVASEAASLAGTLGLGKLIYLYDDNEISIEGSTDIAFSEQVGARFRAYDWHVEDVADGNDVESISRALESAKEEIQRPSLIIVATTIGFGSPHMQGTAEVHGAPLGEVEIKNTKRALGWPEDPPFYVPTEVSDHLSEGSLKRGRQWEADWNDVLAAYEKAHPKDARIWHTASSGRLPSGWDAGVPAFTTDDGPMATRVASGKVLNRLIEGLPTLLGGSADLAPSTNTYLLGHGDIGIDEWCSHNMHFGVREHAMGNIVNGMALHGGVLPYAATFLIFSDGFSSLAEYESKFGVLWSSSPRRFSDEQIEQFKARFPTESIPNDGRDHSVCVASSAGHCQFRWQIGTAEHLMDPITDDDLGANVEVIITDDVDRDTPSTSSYFIAVLPVSPAWEEQSYGSEARSAVYISTFTRTIRLGGLSMRIHSMTSKFCRIKKILRW